MNKTLIINDIDNVAVALTNLKKGEVYNGVTLLEDITQGHKFALKDFSKDENIIKYGYPIGRASQDIKKGEHVHEHNVVTNLSGELEYKFNGDFKDNFEHNCNIKVKVFKRKFNKYGIRNNLLIVPMVGCVNSIGDLIKEKFIKEVDTSKIDEVIVTKHPFGCSQLGDDFKNTVETLKAIVKHPNNGGVLVFALGCENNQLDDFINNLGEYDESRVRFLKAQDVENEIDEGVKLLKELYSNMLKDVRIEAPLSVINIGLKCGGSDGFSGISANPLVGMMSDFLVHQGGTTVLSEVPEMFGAEQILMARSKDEETFNKIVNLINGFKAYYASHNQVCYENPSPGNRAGGITTLEDKSLGCVQKAGTSQVNDCLYLGDELKETGLNLLNGPGNDLMACTNLACIGCHLILFTTGRGTPFGTFIPTLKIATNTPLANKKHDWIDFNAGQIVDGVDKNKVFDDFKDLIISIINGENKAKNEINKFEEISIFKDGVTL